MSEASDPRSDRGEVCCSGGGLHYLFAPRAFIQKPFHIALNRMVAVNQHGETLEASYSKRVDPRPEFALH